VLMVKMQSSKFEIENFSGKNNFELWKLKMHDLLMQQGVVKALLGKEKQPATIQMMTGMRWMREHSVPYAFVWPSMFFSILSRKRQQPVCGRS
jgi:hypothetical protein